MIFKKKVTLSITRPCTLPVLDVVEICAIHILLKQDDDLITCGDGMAVEELGVGVVCR